MQSPRFIFFGQDEFSVLILHELKKAHFIPELIITGPDKPIGRNHVLTPPPVKVWARENSISILQPTGSLKEIISELIQSGPWDVFIVASFGKILPKDLIEIPTHKTLNVHPSLLPRLRGADPIRSAILHEEKTGVTIMGVDEKMDHGPIIAQTEVSFSDWPSDFFTVHKKLAEVGGELLAHTLPPWLAGTQQAREQNHEEATYTTKVTKEDGELNINDGDPRENWRKYLAYRAWPGTYFYMTKNKQKIRLKITEASFPNSVFTVNKVIPEGRKEMLFKDFLRGIRA